ncbi:MAG: hypothetical protein KGM44_10575, partial [bacterium]|nr:hypothetical protein [bacterium]
MSEPAPLGGFPGVSPSPGAAAPAAPRPAPSASPTPAGSVPLAFRVSADRLRYYSDRYEITGTG